VDRAGGTGFGLHFHELHRSAEEVLLAFGGEDIDVLRHRGRRRDRVNGRHFGEVVATHCGRGVAVDRLK